MALRVSETAYTLVLDDTKVVVAGDWHGNRSRIGHAVPAAAATGATTLLHLGDLGLWPGESADLLALIDYWSRRAARGPGLPGIERILLTPGNHEDWSAIANALDVAPGHAVRVSEVVWLLPRGFRFALGGRSALSFGGAASIDRAGRVPYRSWWREEMPTEEDVERAAAGGDVDILLSHDAAGATLVPAVLKVLSGPTWLTLDEVTYSATSRIRVQQVVNAVHPRLHLHGHWHVRDWAVWEGEGQRSLRIESMDMDGYAGNLGLLDLHTLTVTDIDVTP